MTAKNFFPWIKVYSLKKKGFMFSLKQNETHNAKRNLNRLAIITALDKSDWKRDSSLLAYLVIV